MVQAASSQKARHNRISFPVVKAAADGDMEAMTVILRHFDPYIRRLATDSFRGTSYLNTELYDRLKSRLIMATANFKY